MADDLTANPGLGGAVFAADQDPGSGKYYPWGKLAWGGDDVFNKVDDVFNKRFPTKAVGPQGSLIDRSGTIAVGGTSQQLVASTPDRTYLFVFNPRDAIESLFINFSAAAAPNTTSIEIPPGSSWQMSAPNFVHTGQINIVAATGAHAFGAKEG